MIVVADASVLVSEVLRRRGRTIVPPDLRVVVAEDQWQEYELDRRLAVIVRQERLSRHKPTSYWERSANLLRV